MSVGKIINDNKGGTATEEAKAPEHVQLFADRLNIKLNHNTQYSISLDLKGKEYNEFYFNNIFLIQGIA